jgi:general secretion pathway protein G
MLRSKTRGFTLIEWLIVIAIISILLIIIFVHINPLRERDRASDSRRKADLDRISIALEEFYSDHDCYPTQERFEQSEGLRPYLSSTPRDPDTNEAYFYSPQDTNCPQYYRLYANLRWQEDPAITKVGCGAGCGPDGLYNYGVTSPGSGLETGELAIGCAGQDNCTICDDDGEGNCSCNLAGVCCVNNMSDCPGSCEECFLSDRCFSSSDCDGYQGQPMPY